MLLDKNPMTGFCPSMPRLRRPPKGGEEENPPPRPKSKLSEVRSVVAEQPPGRHNPASHARYHSAGRDRAAYGKYGARFFSESAQQAAPSG